MRMRCGEAIRITISQEKRQRRDKSKQLLIWKKVVSSNEHKLGSEVMVQLMSGVNSIVYEQSEPKKLLDFVIAIQLWFGVGN